MELKYPISSDLLTFVHTLNRTIECSLRDECGLSIVQYRALSCLHQAGEFGESRMSFVLSVSPSHLSQALRAIAAREYALSRTAQGPSKLWWLTAKGERAVANADLSLVDACNRVFGPLGPELGSAIRAGSMLTNQRHGLVRIENGRFFEEHACFEAFLMAERITKESTKAHELTETEFRILFELHVGGPSAKSALSRKLLLAPSVISDACRALAARSLITQAEGTADRRVHVMALTEAGRMLVEAAAEHVDRRSMEDLRPSSEEERALYQRMANIVVRDPADKALA